MGNKSETKGRQRDLSEGYYRLRRDLMTMNFKRQRKWTRGDQFQRRSKGRISRAWQWAWGKRTLLGLYDTGE